MITLGDLKTELKYFSANQTISSRISNWAYWATTRILATPYNFWWNQDKQDLTTVDGTAEYYLSYRCNPNKLFYFFDTTLQNGTIDKVDLEKIYKYDSTPTDEGDPINWALVGNYGVQADNDNSVVTVVSSLTSDVSQTVCVHGKSSDVDVVEELSLNGTTSVSGSITFDENSIWQVTLNTECVGYITVTTTGTSTTTIAQIPSGQKRIQCPKIRLWRVPSDARTLSYIFGKNPLKTTKDSDIIDLPDEAFDCLLTGVLHLAHKNNGDIDYSRTLEGDFYGKIQDLINWAEATKSQEMDFCKRSSSKPVFSLPRTITYTVT